MIINQKTNIYVHKNKIYSPLTTTPDHATIPAVKDNPATPPAVLPEKKNYLSIPPDFPHYYTGPPYPDTRTTRARGLPEIHGAPHIRIRIKIISYPSIILGYRWDNPGILPGFA